MPEGTLGIGRAEYRNIKSVNPFVVDMVILNTRRHEGIVQDAVKRRDQYKVRIAVEDGGKIYGGNGFEKDGNGTADHIKMDIAGGSDAPETGTWDSKTVPVAACTGCEGGTHNGRSYGRQTVRGIPY